MKQEHSILNILNCKNLTPTLDEVLEGCLHLIEHAEAYGVPFEIPRSCSWIVTPMQLGINFFLVF